jgi:hypothetical protein
MVARLESDEESRRERLARTLREAGVPGDEPDHRWMAGRILRIVEELQPSERHPQMEELLTAGVLRSCGLEAGIPDLPEDWVRAVPFLMQNGFPARTWTLVRHGILRYGGRPWGDSPRWTLDGTRIAPLLAEWHELGEHLVFRNIARALLPLLQGTNGALQIALCGLKRPQGRRCLQALEQALRDCGAPIGHLFLL